MIGISTNKNEIIIELLGPEAILYKDCYTKRNTRKRMIIIAEQNDELECIVRGTDGLCTAERILALYRQAYNIQIKFMGELWHIENIHKFEDIKGDSL